MRRIAAALLALACVGTVSAAMAQTGDPDRTRRQEALGHAVAIQNAWASVEARVRVTNAANLWEDEWDGRSAPPSGSWWLASWTERGLTARYCGGVLAVYAAADELKGLGRGHREVQVAPVLHGGGRTGLHVILANTRMARGAHGRDDTALPACMPVPSTGEDRVGLVGAVADPIRTVTGIRWETEFRTVACPGSATDTFREARQVPVQITSVLGAGETTGRDLSVTAPGDAQLWPRDCGRRPGLGARAQCSPWRHASGLCPFQYAQADPPEPIPDPVIEWLPAPVHRTTASCNCPAGQTGTCTLHYEQGTEYRDFYVHGKTLGEPAVRTRRVARGDAGRRRLVRRDENCTPIQTGCQSGCGPDGGGPDGGGPGPGGPGGGGVGGGGSSGGSGNSSGGVGEVGGIGGVDGGVTGGHNPGQSNPGQGAANTNSDSDTGGNGGGGGGKPIVLDLDGDGVELVPLDESTAFYDINGDGYRERMAWASADDGFLAYDKDGDGRIAAHDELSFVTYAPGARTDLEGLRHFDTDGDGRLDPDDAEWEAFRVWRDLDRDGESDPGELLGLDEAGIEWISLTSDGVKREVADSTVFGEGRYVGRDGLRAFWDVSLRIGERRQ